MSEQQNEINIALVQTDLAWKDKVANLNKIGQLVMTIKEPIEMIVLPELFNTAFCVDDSSLAENMHGESISFLKEISKQQNCAICGSLLIHESEKVYNRFVFVVDGEILFTYDKHYLFSLVIENQFLQAGAQKVTHKYKGWKIQPFICYDLRFPAWCQNNELADIQIYVASWPTKRIHHWQTLLRARAIENQCYTVGVNRTGKDGYGNAHNGHSCVFDFTGNTCCDMTEKNGIEIVKLSATALSEHKERYPFWKDRLK